MRIACVSDTHGKLEKIPECDLLIVAGDYCPNFTRDSRRDAILQAEWIKRVFNPLIKDVETIVVAGNHDWVHQYYESDGLEAHYLQDSSITIDGLNFYGSPWQPWFYDWAFNFPEGDKVIAQAMWAKISENTDVLITHSPPFGIRDTCPDGYKAGCPNLLKRVKQLNLKLHVFGHIHGGYGQTDKFVNASLCDEGYNPVNPIQVIDV